MSANTKSSKSHWVLIAVWEEAEEMKVTADDLHSRKTYAPNQQLKSRPESQLAWEVQWAKFRYIA